MAVAAVIGVTLEFLIVFAVSLASPPSHVEPAQIDAQLFEWADQPSWLVAVALVPLAPSFFDNSGNAYLAIASLQAIIYTVVAYLLIGRFRKNRIPLR
jgi:hypothetical protein